MQVDPPKDEAMTLLLHDIAKTIGENQRFLQALKEDRIDAEDEESSDELEEEFEEL